MRKYLLGAAIVAAGLVWALAPVAHATDAHYTDGTTFQGSTNFGPPPRPPALADDCTTAIVDPANPVFVTLHFVYGSAKPPATVPVHDDASLVVNYVGTAPGMFNVDVSKQVEGEDGWLAYTWNIGTGVTAWVQFNCAPPVTTTTTSEPSTTTTTQPGTTTTTTVQIGTPIQEAVTGVGSGRPLPVTG